MNKLVRPAMNSAIRGQYIQRNVTDVEMPIEKINLR